MVEYIEQNWLWLFFAAWALGIWGLALALSSAKSGGGMPTLGGLKRLTGGKGAYARIEYKASGRTLEKWLKGQAEVRSLYPRAAFFLLYGSGFQPQALLQDWYTSAHWKEMRGQYVKQRMKAFEQAMSALKAKRIGQLYTPKQAAISRPTSLSFPLLPSEFSVFVAHQFAHMHGGHRGTVPPGIYTCEVVEWSEENSYADSICLTDPTGGDLSRRSNRPLGCPSQPSCRCRIRQLFGVADLYLYRHPAQTAELAIRAKGRWPADHPQRLCA